MCRTSSGPSACGYWWCSFVVFHQWWPTDACGIARCSWPGLTPGHPHSRDDPPSVLLRCSSSLWGSPCLVRLVFLSPVRPRYELSHAHTSGAVRQGSSLPRSSAGAAEPSACAGAPPWQQPPIAERLQSGWYKCANDEPTCSALVARQHQTPRYSVPRFQRMPDYRANPSTDWMPQALCVHYRDKVRDGPASRCRGCPCRDTNGPPRGSS